MKTVKSMTMKGKMNPVLEMEKNHEEEEQTPVACPKKVVSDDIKKINSQPQKDRPLKMIQKTRETEEQWNDAHIIWASPALQKNSTYRKCTRYRIVNFPKKDLELYTEALESLRHTNLLLYTKLMIDSCAFCRTNGKLNSGEDTKKYLPDHYSLWATYSDMLMDVSSLWKEISRVREIYASLGTEDGKQLKRTVIQRSIPTLKIDWSKM